MPLGGRLRLLISGGSNVHSTFVGRLVMTIAKLAYLTSPAPGRYILNFQPFGSDDLISIEVGPDQMRNILNDGVSHWLRNSLHRVALKDDKHDPSS
jgi:hypothetical protein